MQIIYICSEIGGSWGSKGVIKVQKWPKMSNELYYPLNPQFLSKYELFALLELCFKVINNLVKFQDSSDFVCRKNHYLFRVFDFNFAHFWPFL